MNALYNHALKQRNLLQNDLNKFESDLLNSSVSLQGSVSTTLVSFDRTIKHLEDYISKNDDSSDKISKFKIKLNDLKNENKNYQNKFKELKIQYNKSKLFGSINNNNNNNTSSTNTSSSSSSSSENPFNDDNYLNKRNIVNNNRSTTTTTTSSGNGNDSNNNSTTTNYDKQNLLPSFYQNIQREKSIFSRGNAQLDLILEMGNNSLQDIMDQNIILNNIQDRMNKTLRTLNVSQSTIDQINKRLFKDKLIFWIALLLLFIGMYYIIKFFK